MQHDCFPRYSDFVDSAILKNPVRSPGEDTCVTWATHYHNTFSTNRPSLHTDLELNRLIDIDIKHPPVPRRIIVRMIINNLQCLDEL